ncbi:serine hydrolase domain-containing protein [Streptomyces sp. NPDC060209]|uniref:serine hydrolase domain-containing protein n=1 Tax=Streptomyces sp. NPDC060209 TaxID=3347073 RepID=UPI003650041D
MGTTATVRRRRWRVWFGKVSGAALVATAGFGLTVPGAAAAGTAVVESRGAVDAGRWSAIDDFVEGRLDATGTPGAAIAVIEGGRVVHEKGFGKDGQGQAVTPDTPFLWGSVAKPLTALAVMQLVEVGRVALDAPVRTYLPWFRLAYKDVSDRITVRQLLTNTSGIPASADAGTADRYDNAPGALAEAVRDLEQIAPDAEPGESYAYSSAGYAVLGALVEEVSGRDFGTHLREEILDPLGMEHAVASERDFERERVAPGHRFLFDDPVPFDAPYDTSGVPSAHVGGSVGDLSRLALAELGGGQVDGRRVLSAEGITETQRGQVDSDIDRFGLGWSVGTLEGTGERMVWKSGSLPGHDAMVVMLPDSGRAVIVLQNAFHLLRAQEFHHAALGAARILSGADPGSASAELPVSALPWIMVALAGVLALCVAAPVLRVLPGRRTAARSRSRRRIVLNTLGAVAASLTLAVSLWWVLPEALGGTLTSALLWLPDAAWGAVGVVVLALLLAAERTVLAMVDLWGRDENLPDRTEPAPRVTPGSGALC